MKRANQCKDPAATKETNYLSISAQLSSIFSQVSKCVSRDDPISAPAPILFCCVST